MKNSMVAVRIDPFFVNDYITLENVFFGSKRIDDALKCYAKALELDQCSFLAHSNVALLYHYTGRVPEAIGSYKHAMSECLSSIDDDWTHTATLVNFLVLLRSTCNWSTHDVYVKEFIGKKVTIHPSFLIILYPHLSQESMMQSLCSYSSCITSMPTGQSLIVRRGLLLKKNGKIKVGYISSHFNSDGVLVIFSRCIYMMHDHSKFELSFYSTRPLNDRTVWISSGGHIVDLSQMPPFHGAKVIKNVLSDVLVSLDGSYNTSVNMIMSFQPAVVQFQLFSSCDKAFTTPWIQPIITENIVFPIEMMLCQDEGVIKCNDVFVPTNHYSNANQVGQTFLGSDKYDGDDCGVVQSRAHHSISDDVFVFAFSGSPEFIDPRIFKTWMEILTATEDSVLVLLKHSLAVEANLKHKAQMYGIDEERLIFLDVAAQTTLEHRIKMYRSVADLVLDSGIAGSQYFSFSCALFAETPVLALRDDKISKQRISDVLISLTGENRIVAENLHFYKIMAIELSLNGEHYIRIIKKLQLSKGQSKLFDARKWMTNLEVAIKDALNKK